MSVRNVIAYAGAGASVAGQVIAAIVALLVIAFGLLIGIEAAIGLSMPDAQLVKFYVDVITAAKRGPVGREAAALLTAPALVPVVIGLRIVLVVALLLAVGIVNEGWNWCRSAIGRGF
jgi:hypothetical protein